MEVEKVEAPKRVNGRMSQPGESGNPLGRPIGARGRFSQRFIADLATAWEEHGQDALAKTATAYPDRFVAICSHLLPKDVSVSLSAQLPAALSGRIGRCCLTWLRPSRWHCRARVSRPPGAVLEHVLSALRQADAKLIEPAR